MERNIGSSLDHLRDNYAMIYDAENYRTYEEFLSSKPNTSEIENAEKKFITMLTNAGLSLDSDLSQDEIFDFLKKVMYYLSRTNSNFLKKI